MIHSSALDQKKVHFLTQTNDKRIIEKREIIIKYILQYSYQ